MEQKYLSGKSRLVIWFIVCIGISARANQANTNKDFTVVIMNTPQDFQEDMKVHNALTCENLRWGIKTIKLSKKRRQMTGSQKWKMMNFIAELGYVRKIRQVKDRTMEIMKSGEQ